MKTREEAVAYGLTFQDSYEDRPFKDQRWQVIRVKPSKKIFLWIYEKDEKIQMSRAVGNALHKNPDPEHIPCFRVVNAKGELAGAFAFGGANVQAELLREDGVEVIDGKVDLKKYQM